MPAGMAAVTAMPAVAAMLAVKHVKQRAGEQQQKGKDTEGMSSVLSEKEKRSDQQESDRDQAGLGSPKSACLGLRFWFGHGRGSGHAVHVVGIHGMGSLFVSVCHCRSFRAHTR
jgi:hypothetical protein